MGTARRHVRNPSAYVARAILNFRNDCIIGFSDDGAAKRALWAVAVNIYEIYDGADAELSIDNLRRIAVTFLKPGQVDSTLESAARSAQRG